MGLKQQHHFVLVHGAGHGAWCWHKLVPALEEGGHRVTSLDMSSAGESLISADDITTLEQYNRPLEDFFRTLPDDEKVVVVGHSLGGLNITRTSELFPKKISLAIYLGAYMPGIGVDLLKISETDLDLRSQVTWEDHYKVEGGPPTSHELYPEAAEKFLYNKCSQEDIAYAIEHLRPMPSIVMMFQDITLTKENYGSVPRVYIIGNHDEAIVPTSSHKMIKWNPPNEVLEMDADHSMFFSSVETLAKAFIDFASKYD